MSLWKFHTIVQVSCWSWIKLALFLDNNLHTLACEASPGRYVSIIQSNIESGPKMIQFNIQFKTKFEIFIQSKIHSKISLKYSIQNFIQEIGKKWFKMSTWYKCSRKGKKLPSPSNWLFHCCHVNPYLGTRGTLITM